MCSPELDLKLTPEMLDAALNVEWIEAHMFEFMSVDEAENRRRMHAHITELWEAMLAARASSQK